MALESSPDEIKAFLEQLAGQAGITDFIQNLCEETRSNTRRSRSLSCLDSRLSARRIERL